MFLVYISQGKFWILMLLLVGIIFRLPGQLVILLVKFNRSIKNNASRFFMLLILHYLLKANTSFPSLSNKINSSPSILYVTTVVKAFKNWSGISMSGHIIFVDEICDKSKSVSVKFLNSAP